MSSTLSLLRVLVVNDQRDMCEMWQRMIDMAPGLTCPGYAVDGEHALEMVEHHHPHVVFMDILMPVMGGIEATKLIRQNYPNTVVILYSAYNHNENLAREAGAAAFILMPIQPDKLVSIIRRTWREHSNE